MQNSKGNGNTLWHKGNVKALMLNLTGTRPVIGQGLVTWEPETWHFCKTSELMCQTIHSLPTKTWNEETCICVAFLPNGAWWRRKMRHKLYILYKYTQLQNQFIDISTEAKSEWETFFSPQTIQVCTIIPQHCRRIVELDPRLLGGGSVIFQIQPARRYSADTQLAASSSWRRRVKVSKDKPLSPPPTYHTTAPQPRRRYFLCALKSHSETGGGGSLWTWQKKKKK